ncbi:MAG: exosortase/archaeosortase family protein [Peptococcaceae bacterium]|nr:exosortase/archaeosortase family protein [Peptococcaceae bacterium]
MNYLKAYQLKLALWVLVSIIIFFSFGRLFWSKFLDNLSYSYIIGGHHAAPYGLLFLCAFFLFLRKKELKEEMAREEGRKSPVFSGTGIILVAVSFFLPPEEDFLILKPAFALTGSFAILFGRAVKTPLLVTGIYTAAAAFPLMIMRYAEAGYAKTAILPVKIVTGMLGLPLMVKGQHISFSLASGDPITVTVTADCAGPSTMGVFLGLFALMYLDMPIPVKRAAAVFAFGLAGTWIQNTVRLVIILLAGYLFGQKALWSVHSWTIYILFPAWYLVFALVYFKLAGTGSMDKPA